MALNVKKREAKRLKSDQMIEEAMNQGKTTVETSSKVILEELNNELDKDVPMNPPTEESTAPITASTPIEQSAPQPKKVGRKKKYFEERDLVHLRITAADRKDVDMALFTRNQNMQDYLTDLIKEDMKKNKDKYVNVYNTLNAFKKELN